MSEDTTATTTGGPPPGPPRRVPLRAAATWGLGLVATLTGVAAAGIAGVVLTTFGLGGAVLAAGAALLLVGATAWRRAMLPLAAVALGLSLPAAWAAQAGERVDRSRGVLTVAPRSAADLRDAPYRHGVGPVLVDLRRFSAANGSTTRIAAQADAGRLVVALPRDRCFNLDVRFHVRGLSGPTQFAVNAARLATGREPHYTSSVSGIGLTSRAAAAESAVAGLAAELAAARGGEGNATLPYDLLAFNRTATQAGRYRRVAFGQPNAPTLRLDLRSPEQIVIRDYPNSVGPLTETAWVGDQIGGLYWPEGLQAPRSPAERLWAMRSEVRTREYRARWIAWEDEMIAWAKEQARRAAGPCATPQDIQARGFSFLTQPEAVRDGKRVRRLLGSSTHRRSSIPQRPVLSERDMIAVEVDGFGHTRLVGDDGIARNAGNGIDAVGPRPLLP